MNIIFVIVGTICIIKMIKLQNKFEKTIDKIDKMLLFNGVIKGNIMNENDLKELRKELIKAMEEI